MKLLLQCAVLILSVGAIFGQISEGEKPDSCPPALPVEICEKSCSSDYECQGSDKCCPTYCGGTACSKPVTVRSSKEKPGVCPSKSTGRWICSSTCTYDNDCRGSLKCCMNRCGAMVCLKPEVTDTVETPPREVPFDGSASNNREVYANRPPSNYPSNYIPNYPLNYPSNYPPNYPPSYRPNYPSRYDYPSRLPSFPYFTYYK